MNFAERYERAERAAAGEPIPLVRVKHGSARHIIALDEGTTVRHVAGPRPVAIVDRGGDVVTVLAGGREMNWKRWMGDMWSAKR
jgi:hypothetical protein